MPTTSRAARGCLLLALLMAGCAERGAGSPPSAGVLGEWELTEGTSTGVPLPQPAIGRATLALEDGQLGGVSFCNYYGATYRLDGDALVIDGLGGTEMGCEPDVMAAESAYLEALEVADEARVEGEDLVLSGDGATLRFRRVSAVPTRELTGTDWLLDTLVDGERVSSVLGQSTLRLDADGTVRGTTACRAFSGTWTVAETELALTDLVTEDQACPEELRRQDEHELAVLGSALSVGIAEDRLTLTAPDGTGLSYRDGTR